MNTTRIIVYVIAAVLAIVGFKFYMDNKAKQEVKDQQTAGEYFQSLMVQEQTQTVGNDASGKPLHPWYLTQTPTLLEIEDKIKIARGREGDWFTWDFKYDPTGKGNPKPYHVETKFDYSGKLESMTGLNGKVGRVWSQWSAQ